MNFFNPSNYDFKTVKNFISLGNYQQFLDSSSFNCNVDGNSKTLVCEHGLFLHGGASSMAFKTHFLGSEPFPLDELAVSFTDIGTTAACTYLLNGVPLG